MSGWERVLKTDARAIELSNRHYSRVAYGKIGAVLGPPGRLLCYATPERNALWVSHWPYAAMALDGLDAFRCTMFRNESQHLASDMIRAAMLLTEATWSEQGRPADGWITWVDASLVTSEIPGYCFRRAGWHRDRAWRPSRKGSGLIRLHRSLLTKPWPTPMTLFT